MEIGKLDKKLYYTHVYNNKGDIFVINKGKKNDNMYSLYNSKYTKFEVSLEDLETYFHKNSKEAKKLPDYNSNNKDKKLPTLKIDKIIVNTKKNNSKINNMSEKDVFKLLTKINKKYEKLKTVDITFKMEHCKVEIIQDNKILNMKYKIVGKADYFQSYNRLETTFYKIEEQIETNKKFKNKYEFILDRNTDKLIILIYEINEIKTDNYTEKYEYFKNRYKVSSLYNFKFYIYSKGKKQFGINLIDKTVKIYDTYSKCVGQSCSSLAYNTWGSSYFKSNRYEDVEYVKETKKYESSDELMMYIKDFI